MLGENSVRGFPKKSDIFAPINFLDLVWSARPKGAPKKVICQGKVSVGFVREIEEEGEYRFSSYSVLRNPFFASVHATLPKGIRGEGNSDSQKTRRDEQRRVRVISTCGQPATALVPNALLHRKFRNLV